MATWSNRVVVAVVVVLLVIAVVTLVARFAQWQMGPLLFLVAATPYLLVVCAVAGVLSLLVRQWTLAALAGVGVLVVAALWAPPFIGSREEPGPAALTVMTVNLQFGGADPADVVAAVRQSGAEILSVQELTVDAQVALEQAGLREVLPHRYAVPQGRASGSGIWSAFPLSDRRPLTDTWLVNLAATAQTTAGPVTVVAVHPGAPMSLDHEPADTDAQTILEQLVVIPGPTVVAGDFNATRDNRLIRQLEQAGFTDSATAAGSGLIRTWPTHLAPLPPLVGIDHVMTRQFPPAVSAHTVPISGTDHLGLVVDLPQPYSVD